VKGVLMAIALLVVAATARGQQSTPRPRARDLGVPFTGTPGPFNAITDVAGVEVGETTIISGSGAKVVGKGPVRTGVTAILPRGHAASDTVFAGWATLNGNGEMTGTTWVRESGFLEGPVLITNTISVGTVRDAVIAWSLRNGRRWDYELPVVAETWDGNLNDIEGFHVRAEHVLAALDGARGGPVPEGNVGGGTGMKCHEFKGGTGTSSRRVTTKAGSYTVGVLVQCNYGFRSPLRVAGVPVGEEIRDLMPCFAGGAPERAVHRSEYALCGAAGARVEERDVGSIIVVIATDAPLLPHQLERLAKRATVGIARNGGYGSNTSGDIFIAFSTANAGAASATDTTRVTMLPNDEITPLFAGVAEATEESIINALVAAETMTGVDNFKVWALPHDRLQALLKKYNRLTTPD